MDAEIFALISMFLFCLCCHQFMRTVTTPAVTVFDVQRVYAKSALKVGKAYKATAWGVMTLSFMVGVGVSFYQVFSTTF